MIIDLNNNHHIFHFENNITMDKIYITNLHTITRDKISLYFHNNMITNLNNNNYIFHLHNNITTDRIYFYLNYLFWVNPYLDHSYLAKVSNISVHYIYFISSIFFFIIIYILNSYTTM